MSSLNLHATMGIESETSFFVALRHFGVLPFDMWHYC